MKYNEIKELTTAELAERLAEEKSKLHEYEVDSHVESFGEPIADSCS